MIVLIFNRSLSLVLKGETLSFLSLKLYELEHLLKLIRRLNSQRKIGDTTLSITTAILLKLINVINYTARLYDNTLLLIILLPLGFLLIYAHVGNDPKGHLFL